MTHFFGQAGHFGDAVASVTGPKASRATTVRRPSIVVTAIAVP